MMPVLVPYVTMKKLSLIKDIALAGEIACLFCCCRRVGVEGLMVIRGGMALLIDILQGLLSAIYYLLFAIFCLLFSTVCRLSSTF